MSMSIYLLLLVAKCNLTARDADHVDAVCMFLDANADLSN